MSDYQAVIVKNSTAETKTLRANGDSITMSPHSRSRVDPHFAENLPTGVKAIQGILPSGEVVALPIAKPKKPTPKPAGKEEQDK